MKIKLPFLLAVCVCFMTFYSANSQNIKPSISLIKYNDNVNAPLNSKELKQINEVYGDKSNEYVLNRPQRLKDIKNLLRNRIEIKLISNPNDQKQCPLLSEVPLLNYYVSDLRRDTVFNPQTFNPLKYLFNVNGLSGEMYRVDNTNYFIIIKSQFQ
ncbi:MULTISPECIES: hypothetical protein [Flavobacteriaceae]|jgi:hypothetical protein|uniref:Uncharacterized protein n=2 Tax=Flavobacteriaceae TaxID=49546 RepID=A0ABN1JKK4_9FLAO|nr:MULTISPECIES: hypothetical protein [Meridianimaribacter]RYH75381.1 hypothetical protein EVU94_00010 [Flavobacteriaceae bacterium 144Ye]TDY14366.1 hypothetical protein A8975_0977 [Meridianimaribacter flavus]